MGLEHNEDENGGEVNTMLTSTRHRFFGAWLMLALALALLGRSTPALAATAAELDRDVDVALQKLFQETPTAKEFAGIASGILVFPSIIKARFIVGAQYGDGALRVKGKTEGYYNTVAASFGLQAGVQALGYALFFMTEKALKYLDTSGGWELGTAPSIVIVDQGIVRGLSTASVQVTCTRSSST